MGASNRAALVATIISCLSGCACSHGDALDDLAALAETADEPTSDPGTNSGGDDAGMADSRHCWGTASAGPDGGPDPLLIDDFEDGDLHIPRTDGRFGIWSWENIPEGWHQGEGLIELTALEPPRGCGAHVRVSESGSLPFRASLEVNLFDEQAYPRAAEYAGIGFWIKHGESGAPSLRVELPTTDTSSEHGGDDDHARISLELGDEWQLVRLLWNDAELRQGGWGAPYNFDPEKLTRLQFRSDSVRFDFLLDDVRFIPKSLDAGDDAGLRSDAGADAGKPDACPNDAGGPPMGTPEAINR